jgi:hypothetical protein
MVESLPIIEKDLTTRSESGSTIRKRLDTEDLMMGLVVIGGVGSDLREEGLSTPPTNKEGEKGDQKQAESKEAGHFRYCSGDH